MGQSNDKEMRAYLNITDVFFTKQGPIHKKSF